MSGQYFTSERLTPRVTRIRDILGVGLYLVEGRDRACVIDTGHGLGDLRGYIETLTDKPTFVILTHGHIDHVGGASLWDEVYLNPIDLDLFHDHNSLATRQASFQDDSVAGSIPLSDYAPERTAPLLPLANHQVFDLGGITLETIAVPGHTPGIMCILMREERMILFGDACGLEVLLCFPDSSPVSEYLAALSDLKAVEGDYDRILRNHGTGESPKELLDNVISCCLDILEGHDAAQETIWNGMTVLSARPVDEAHRRLDGKEGNILYLEEKRR